MLLNLPQPRKRGSITNPVLQKMNCWNVRGYWMQKFLLLKIDLESLLHYLNAWTKRGGRPAEESFKLVSRTFAAPSTMASGHEYNPDDGAKMYSFAIWYIRLKKSIGYSMCKKRQFMNNEDNHNVNNNKRQNNCHVKINFVYLKLEWTVQKASTTLQIEAHLSASKREIDNTAWC